MWGRSFGISARNSPEIRWTFRGYRNISVFKRLRVFVHSLMSINFSAFRNFTFLDEMGFFFPIQNFLHHLLWLKLFQSWVLFRHTGQAGMSSIQSAASRTHAARLSLRAKIKTLVSQRYITFCALSSSRWIIVIKKIMFLTVVDDGLPRTVCDTCHYRVETMWKNASVVIPGHHLSKRRHPLSPLTSSQVDEETASQINKKKGYRIPFETIRPKPPALVMSSKEANIWNEKGTQTRNSGCHCFPVSSKEHVCQGMHSCWEYN